MYSVVGNAMYSRPVFTKITSMKIALLFPVFELLIALLSGYLLFYLFVPNPGFILSHGQIVDYHQ
jgi:hypothetical protein